MLHEELQSIREALGSILGKVSPDDADLIRQCRRNLDAAADQAEALESRLIVDTSRPRLSDNSAIRLMNRPPLMHELAAEGGA